MKKAFTLIELLVVIAIIAILAAILFPVFAQAKAAAKASASISNSKQSSLATIQYSADVDDMFVITQSNGNQAGSYTIGTQSFTPWTKLVQPYMKNADVFRDPLGPNAQAFTGLTTQDSWFLTPHYGFNTAGLNDAYNVGYFSKSQTEPANPADTVLLVSKHAYQDVVGGGFYAVGYSSGWSAYYQYMALPPTGFVDARRWGKGGSWDSQTSTVTAGRFTGGNALRASNNFVVAFTDGHVGKRAPGALAAGTNFRFDATGANQSTTSEIVINDESKYLWDVK